MRTKVTREQDLDMFSKKRLVWVVTVTVCVPIMLAAALAYMFGPPQWRTWVVPIGIVSGLGVVFSRRIIYDFHETFSLMRGAPRNYDALERRYIALAQKITRTPEWNPEGGAGCTPEQSRVIGAAMEVAGIVVDPSWREDHQRRVQLIEAVNEFVFAIREGDDRVHGYPVEELAALLEQAGFVPVSPETTGSDHVAMHVGRLLYELRHGDGSFFKAKSRPIVDPARTVKCPEPPELVAYAGAPGREPLDAVRKEEISQHLRTCRACNEFIGEVVAAHLRKMS